MLDSPTEMPPFRQVCRESRRAADEVGCFVAELCGSNRSGWFNFTIDEVFIHVDTISRFQHMNLDRVEILAFPQCSFGTRERCSELLLNIQQWAPCCRIVKIYLCSSTTKPGAFLRWNGETELPELADDDVVGYLPTVHPNDCVHNGTRWSDFRHAVKMIWSDLTRISNNRIVLPTLVGVKAFCC